MIHCEASKCQTRGKRMSTLTIRPTRPTGRRTEADHFAASLVLLACPGPRLAGRAPHGGRNAAGPRHHESDAHGGARLRRDHRGLCRRQHGAPRNRAGNRRRLCGVLPRDDRRAADHLRAIHALDRGRARRSSSRSSRSWRTGRRASRWSRGGWEYPLFWGLILFAIALRGGGPYSLDRKLGWEL